MSYVGLNPAQLGVLVPQDPLTGLLRLDMALIFDLLQSVSVQSQGQVARHPIQSGREGPSDAILEEPERVSVSAMFVDKPMEIGITFPGFAFAAPDRCLQMAHALRAMKSRRQLLTAVLPGFVLADRAISMLDVTPSPDGAEVAVQFTLEHVRVVSLTLLPVQADSDSKALGEQTVQVGF